MMGHMSAAYAARAARDLSLCSRFDFNIYSYESEWAIGAEWWLRRGPPNLSSSLGDESSMGGSDNEDPVVMDEMAPPGQDTPSPFPTKSLGLLGGDVTGVVKARISTSSVSSSTGVYAYMADLEIGHIADVGRSSAEPARQLGCRVRPFEPVKAH
jgi:distribution and morphology protein 10